MDTTTKRPWQPGMTTYPLLILDDHAMEWASQITDEDPDRIEIAGAGSCTHHTEKNGTLKRADTVCVTVATPRVAAARGAAARLAAESHWPRAA
jgi:hypothetical protein